MNVPLMLINVEAQSWGASCTLRAAGSVVLLELGMLKGLKGR